MIQNEKPSLGLGEALKGEAHSDREPIYREPVRLEERFQYHAPKPWMQGRFDNVRSAAAAFSAAVLAVVPPGRESDLAQGKIEEAMFWANAGIARKG